MQKRYDSAITDSFHAVEKTNFYDAVYSPIILISNAVAVAVVMLFSASGNASVLSLFGMSAGTAVSVINYISQIFAPIESLGMEIQTIQSAIAGVHRINEFFRLSESQSPKSKNPDNVKKEEFSPLIKFDNVSFGYDNTLDHAILTDLNLSIQKGEQVTLSGRTGAGKSTIFKLLLCLYEPQKGQVLIDGISAAKIEDTDRRRIFGYVANPKILLLDEITASLDAQTEKEILLALQRLAVGRTVISISHRLGAQMGRIIPIA